MGDEDDVNQVKEDNDGVIALGGGRTCIYTSDENGTRQVKKLGGG
jgi:hypothetical protein